jgi:hypothetical protein
MVNCPSKKRTTSKNEMIKMAKNDIENFLAELTDLNAARAAENKPTFIERDTLKPEFDVLYKDYILEGYTPGIEGNYGVNTAVRMVEPENGRRVTMWLSGYTCEHLESIVNAVQNDGGSFPMRMDFLLHKKESSGGRTYNRFSAIVRENGDAVELPAVPEDQYAEASE